MTLSLWNRRGGGFFKTASIARHPGGYLRSDETSRVVYVDSPAGPRATHNKASRSRSRQFSQV